MLYVSSSRHFQHKRRLHIHNLSHLSHSAMALRKMSQVAFVASIITKHIHKDIYRLHRGKMWHEIEQEITWRMGRCDLFEWMDGDLLFCVIFCKSVTNHFWLLGDGGDENKMEIFGSLFCVSIKKSDEKLKSNFHPLFTSTPDWYLRCSFWGIRKSFLRFCSLPTGSKFFN